jgi:molecular chaperone GrpE
MQKKPDPQNENEKSPAAGNAPNPDEAQKTSAAAEAQEAPGDVDGAAAAEADPGPRLEALAAKAADLKDKLLRAMAETENVRRRAERDKKDASKYAITAFARDMVGVSDNLKRAIESAAGQGGEENENAPMKLKNLLEGVEMTEREMINALERAGVTPVEALGRPFDHNYHEAMFEIEDPSRPAGTVLQVLQVGYRLGERLLRPAKVGVAKGGPKAVAKAAGEGESSEQAPKQAKAYEKGGKASGGKVDEEL